MIFLFFTVNMVTLISFGKLSQPCIPEISPSWSCSFILSIYCFNLLAIFSRVLYLWVILICNIKLLNKILVPSLFWSHKMSLEMFPPPLFLKISVRMALFLKNVLIEFTRAAICAWGFFVLFSAFLVFIPGILHRLWGHYSAHYSLFFLKITLCGIQTQSFLLFMLKGY